MLLLIFLFGSYALKTVSLPPIKVQTKSVHLRNPTNPWPMRKKTHTGLPPKPFLLSPFEIMYGCPSLLGNLPPTDSAPLADYLPYLNLLRELLREHADQILPYPIKISIKPGDLVLLKDLQPSPLGLQWTSPHLVILTTTTAAKLKAIPQWQHLSRNS
jgi:hypothetical protein